MSSAVFTIVIKDYETDVFHWGVSRADETVGEGVSTGIVSAVRDIVTTISETLASELAQKGQP